MTARPLPPEDYCYPDARNVRIRELEVALLETEAALLETNDIAAWYSSLLEIPWPPVGVFRLIEAKP